MGIKDLFGKKSNKILSKAKAEKVAEDLESHEYMVQNSKKNRKLVTRVDFSEPKNFANYGSAEKYYEDSIKWIYSTYPYDGSLTEKLKWQNEASELDDYLLTNKYPTAVGHLLLNGSSSHLVKTSYQDSGGQYPVFDSPQYISMLGGPHKQAGIEEGQPFEASKQFPPKGGDANIWNEKEYRTSNLGFDPQRGNTLEFWSKFEDDSWVTSGQAACLFDLWNGQEIGTSNYLRMMVEVLPSHSSPGDFHITYKFGNGSEGVERLPISLTTETKSALGTGWRTSWQHYSFTMMNHEGAVLVKLYVNGVYEAKATIAGSAITSTVPQESYKATINALRTIPTLASSRFLIEGTGGAPGFYIDEFRFWKVARNAKEVGRNWFTNIGGGTNTDHDKINEFNPVELGVYYKFNEGVWSTTTVNGYDAQALDYSGRASNGTIVGYELGVRKLTSAMDESVLVVALEEKESPDPIMYPNHPDIIALTTSLKSVGRMWDDQNNASFYHTMPAWILDDDAEREVAKELVQTLSSYFDTLHHQISTLNNIKDADYFSLDSPQNKPFFFAKSLLRSHGFEVVDIFNEATILEEVMSRGEQEIFNLRIQEVKNVIYQNIYNNLPYIYKSKGTEKSFRNLIRCFGVDDELIKINLYADGVDYTLSGRRKYTAIKKNYVDFNNVDRWDGTVYSHDATSSSSDERGYIAGMTAARSRNLSITFTGQVLFPRPLPIEHSSYQRKTFTTVSLFGTKEANLGGGDIYNDTGLGNIGRFQIQAIRGVDETGQPSRDSVHAKFKLIYTDADGDHELITDEYKDVYDNTTWNFAVRLTPVDTDFADYVDGSSVGQYKLEFYGVQMILDEEVNSFTKTAYYTGATAVAKAQAMIATPKIVYCGHYRSNFGNIMTGTVQSDVKVTDLMYWFDYLSDEEINIHAMDVGNAGRLHPNDDAYAFFQQLSDGTTTDIRVPKKDTLALHWDFTNVTTSDASAKFVVNDLSQGGQKYASEARYGWFTDLVGYKHQGEGAFDPASNANDRQVVNREYRHTARHRLPEVLSGDDMIEIRTQDDDLFTKDSRPINHFFAIEKSMSQVISDEMINFFASVVEFNDLIGQPVHRYRMNYKGLQKLRSLFYERVDNVPSFEKFVEFYKWIDSSMGYMLQQLIPASGNFSESVRNMIENHLLERSKYWTKFPTLEMNQDPPEGQLRGIRELTYDWEHGSAPIMSPATATIVISDAGGIGHGDTFTLIDSAGTSTVYTINGGILPANGGGSGGAATVGFLGVGGGTAGKIAAAAAIASAINATSDANYTAVSDGSDTVTITQGTAGLAGNRTNIDSIGSTTVSNFTNGTGSDSPDSCLWWSERTERTWDGFDTDSDIDKDRESIRKSKVRDILGQNKMVPVGTDGFVEQGEPTLYDIANSKQYEGSTYATRRLSVPYKLNTGKSLSIGGGPNVADATLASTNDMLRAATSIGEKIVLTRLTDDAEKCRDDYEVQGGPKNKKRRAHVVSLVDTLGVVTEVKGSLFAPPFYGAHPNDTAATQQNITHDSYGQDHEVPMQGVFAAEWVGGNQHRHVDLNTGSPADDVTTRPELYRDNGSGLVHPFDINPAHPSARHTRDGMAKRPFNIANVNTAVNEDNYTTYSGTPKLGNYTRDYEVVQTSGRSQNNRWLVRNPQYTPNSIASTYVAGLYDFTLPDRTKDSSTNTFGRTEHVFVERFSAPGEPATLSRGALDIQAEEFSAYNSLNFRNLRVRNHLNFWHKEHTAQFGYREDYIHGTPADYIDADGDGSEDAGESNDFGGNTPNVGAWHKNNRNPLTRMYLENPTTVHSERSYDNFFVGHQIPRSDWQYNWITSSAVHHSNIVEIDDEMREAYSPTPFPHSGDPLHPRISGYVTDFGNADISTAGSLDLLVSGSIGIEHFNTSSNSYSVDVVDVDFSYGNYVVAESIDWENNQLGQTCPKCIPLIKKIEDLGVRQIVKTSSDNYTSDTQAYSDINAILLNRNGPYQGAGWKMLRNVENPIVRQQRRRNVITVQDIPVGLKVYEKITDASPALIKLVIKSVPSSQFMITSTLTDTNVNVSSAELTSAAGNLNWVANMIASKINYAYNDLDKKKLIARTKRGSNVVLIRTVDEGAVKNLDTLTLNVANADLQVDGDGNPTSASSIYFVKPSEDFELIKASSSDMAITSGGYGKFIQVNFTGGKDRGVKSFDYKDRRSDKHEKYLEPPAAWNKPMVHIVSEKNDIMGARVVHTYSNNLEGFANPKLTRRTSYIKENEQFYDNLFSKYSPSLAEKPSIDFIGLFYKEYIFPKHRNVGLLKTRSRVKWDDITKAQKSHTVTGDLRVFWKDSPLERVKGAYATNAIGYRLNIQNNYLSLTLHNNGKADSWNRVRSIFAMDNFTFSSGSSTPVDWQCLGDLQYIGAPTYLSWIVNRNCKNSAKEEWSISELELDKQALDSFIATTQVELTMADASGTGASRTSDPGSSTGSSSGGFVSREGTHPALNGRIYGMYDEQAFVSAASEATGQAPIFSMNGRDVTVRTGIGENQVKNADGANSSTDSFSGPVSSDGGADLSGQLNLQMNNFVPGKIDGRCIAPEPVVQLYYNPYAYSTYREGAWNYVSHELSGKNPWYNKYTDFSLENRSMAQNYGVVAEFKISEHMDKYLLDSGGDFRAKNYNFLSLQGASYKTVAPHTATQETQWSGKTSYTRKSFYSIDGSEDGEITEFVHADYMFSMYSSVAFASAVQNLPLLRNRLLLQNNAFSSEHGVGTFNNPAPYVQYGSKNELFASGDMKLSNSIVTIYPKGGKISSETPWTGKNTWGTQSVDDGTGRHRYFAAGEDLDPVASIGSAGSYKGSDSDSDNLFGYEDNVPSPDGKPPVYREANSYSEWTPIVPRSHGEAVSLKFNMAGATNEFMHGRINLVDNITTSSPMDTDITRIDPFKLLSETVVTDTLRVPLDAAGSPAAQTRKELRGGTPITISLWAKPEKENSCDTDEYDERIEGLYTFGSYQFHKSNSVYGHGKKKPGAWRKDLKSAKPVFSVYSSFPSPSALREKYPSGMGLTLYIPSLWKNNVDSKLISHAGSDEETASTFAGEGLYHFFRYDADTEKTIPATLPRGVWSQVVVQFMPPTSTSPAKVKMILSGNYTGQDILYGIHRSALTDTSHFKKAYQCVPLGAGLNPSPWGGSYGGQIPITGAAALDYKLGKGTFPDEQDYVAKGLSSQNVDFAYFHGELMELSMWSGILSHEDLAPILHNPANLLEKYLNGEVIGGYTNTPKFEAQWGVSSLDITLPNALTITHGGAAINYSKSAAGIGIEASRSRCKLFAWHRLGVRPTVQLTDKCEDYDDEFFNSYVHTDTVQFYDAVVEDHDNISDTLKKRIRLKVNALKKLMPYRGFYPQDRTLQLANLFREKMSQSIAGADTTVLHDEQTMQAALQPFFAPGILYNSIKAGVAVDWAAFTNETGLEPTYPNSPITLPYYNEDIKNLEADAPMDANGPDVYASSIVPNWYSPRENSFSATQGLLLDFENLEGGAEPTDEDLNRVHQTRLAELYQNQPKFNAAPDKTSAALAKNGYVILSEPNTRIPFEGLVAIDSVLPSATDTASSIEETISSDAFRWVDLEISGWDAEGVEIRINQPVPTSGYNDPSTYPVGEEITDNWAVETKSITIGDPGREITGDDWDIEINFRRCPAGFSVPSFDAPGSYVSGALVDNDPDSFELSVNELNEEIAVKLCREINQRSDIHFVAIPGWLNVWNWSNEWNPDFLKTDDHVARLFPAVYPELFGINRDDLRPTPGAEDHCSYALNLWNSPDIWYGYGTSKAPVVGQQKNGTWRIRLVYVGPPKLSLDMSLVDLSENSKWTEPETGHLRLPAGTSLNNISVRPYSNAKGSDPSVDAANPDADIIEYDPTNLRHNTPSEWDLFHWINGEWQEEAIINPDAPRWRMGAGITDTTFGNTGNTRPGGGSWKARHLVNPWKSDLHAAFDEDMMYGGYPCDVGVGEDTESLPTYWHKGAISGYEPYSFFDGGGWQAFSTEKIDASLGDVCSVSITRHLGALSHCRWINGYGWFGQAKYSIDTELGVRYVSSSGATVKGNFYDKHRKDVTYPAFGFGGVIPPDALLADAGAESALGSDGQGGVIVELEESSKPEQGPFGLYGGWDANQIESVRVTPKPYQIYLMVPEYYIGHRNNSNGTIDVGGLKVSQDWAGHWKNYCYPYFEYLGSNGDVRFEMAMHNFLAEIPNFFLRDKKLISFSSKPEHQFKTMESGKTYYMDITMYQSDNFCTVASPHSDNSALGSPRSVAMSEATADKFSMEGRYFGPAFRWKSVDDYTEGVGTSAIEGQMLRDPAQAPYVPPYLYGKARARISFTAQETRKYSLEEIFAGVEVDNFSQEQYNKFIKCAQEDAGERKINRQEIETSPAWRARTTISSSMNLFGKTTIKQITFSAQLDQLRDNLDESLQKFVPQTASDPNNSDHDQWVIGTKFECPILNFYNSQNLNMRTVNSKFLKSGKQTYATTPDFLDSINVSALLSKTSGLEYLNNSTSSGIGIWAGYGKIPQLEEGVFVTVEETLKQREDFSTPRGENVGSLIDVCGFQPQKQRLGEIADTKEISEAVVMIPFVDKPSETTAETIVVDGRNFFKIDKDLFNIQKANIENGKPAVGAGQWIGTDRDISETSISKMIRSMKKYNLPPRFDFVRYPMEASDNPFVMYIFEFHHKLSQQDLSDIWQGLPPTIAKTAEHDSSMLIHDLSPVDFFGENTLPKHVRWMTFKVKKRAKEDYFQSTADGSDDNRFEFNFEIGKKPPKYNYNWPYDYFTMLEMVQVEAGVDIVQDKIIKVSKKPYQSSQKELSAADLNSQISQTKNESTQDTSIGSTANSFEFGSDDDR